MTVSAETAATTWCKICGLTRVQDALSAVAAGADGVGMIFYSGSPRHVSMLQASQISSAVKETGKDCQRVGLFVNASAKEVATVLETVELDLLQFHGDEAPDFCQQFGKPYMKVVKVRNSINVADYAGAYADAWALLLDTYHPIQAGGTGQVFDWSLWPDTVASRLILAGGLTPDNVGQAVDQVHPYGVDVSGGVEAHSKGVKVTEKIEQFIRNAKHG